MDKVKFGLGAPLKPPSPQNASKKSELFGTLKLKKYYYFVKHNLKGNAM